MESVSDTRLAKKALMKPEESAAALKLKRGWVCSHADDLAVLRCGKYSDVGGLIPLDLHQYAVIEVHVRSILNRAIKTSEKIKKRKWEGFQWANEREVEVDRPKKEGKQ